MELFLDPGDHRSLTLQLYDQLREAIADGRLPTGARLQPSRAVAEKLAIARSTVTDAYARLTAEGLVEGRRGGGSIVTGGACVEPSPAATRTALIPSPEAAAIRRYGGELATPARYDACSRHCPPRPGCTSRCSPRPHRTTTNWRLERPDGSSGSRDCG